MFEQPPNLVLPDGKINSVITAAEIMERAPSVIAYLDDRVRVHADNIELEKAKIKLENPLEKDTKIRAMVITAMSVQEAIKRYNEYKTILTMWEHAEANAKIFYRTFCG